ncbi:LysR family transcriptional regulator substrate-binding protein, partial [Streptomyces albidoflavus]
PEQAHTATGWPAILALVGAELGVALVPRMVSAEYTPGSVVVRPLEADRPRRHVIAAVRRGAEQGGGPVARVLAALRAGA